MKNQINKNLVIHMETMRCNMKKMMKHNNTFLYRVNPRDLIQRNSLDLRIDKNNRIKIMRVRFFIIIREKRQK